MDDSPAELRVITCNVSAEFLSPPGVPCWDDHRDVLAQALGEASPDVIALQEATPRQQEDLRRRLPGFSALTVPVTDPDPAMLKAWRDKYARHGLEAPPEPYEIALFYRREAFERVDGGHWWLSPTPERPSIGFGNVVLWARLKACDSGREVVVFNTHIDHRCPDPMVALIRERVRAMRLGETSRLFVGDLNFNPDDENYQRLLADGWRDSHAPADGVEAATFMYDLPGIPSGRIDHILYQGEGLAPVGWRRLASPEPGRRLSDHDPVYACFRWA